MVCEELCRSLYIGDGLVEPVEQRWNQGG